MPVDLAAVAQELEAAGLLPAQRSCVFLVGSMARGWDNPSSDVDVCVVAPQPWTGPPGGSGPQLSLPVLLEPDTIQVQTGRVVGRRCELKYWLDGQFDQLIGKVDRSAAVAGRLVQGAFAKDELSLIDRLPHAVAVEGAAWLDRRRERLDTTALQILVGMTALAIVDGYVEDVAGQVAAGDLESAVLTARLAYEHAVDALLAGYGETSPQPKWRVRRMRAAVPDQLPFEDFWAVETMRDLDPADPLPWVKSVLRACQDLTAEVEL